MGLEDVPPHYLIMHQFIYQAERGLKGDSEAGRVGYTGKTREVAAQLQQLGWRRADYNRESLDADGNPVIKRQINRDSFWFRPEHWQRDMDVFPPVAPRTPDAQEFMRSIRRGRRMTYQVDVKREIMDALVGYMSDGKVGRWTGGAGGEARPPVDRLDRPSGPKAEFPSDVDPWLLIPEQMLLGLARRKDPTEAELAEKGLGRLGWQRSSPGNRERGVWYNPEHWEPAIGGELGLLPTTPEAEEYAGRLPDSPPNVTKRFLPDASFLPDIEVVVRASIDAARAPAPVKAAKPAGMRPKAPTPGLGHQQRGYHSAAGHGTGDIPKEPGARRPPTKTAEPDDDDLDDDDDDLAADDDIEGMSAAELDKRAQDRWAQAKASMKGARDPRPRAPSHSGSRPERPPAKRPDDEDDDSPIFADD